MFITSQCIAPPHPVEQTVTLITRYVSERVTPINRPSVCINATMEPDVIGKAVQGTVYFRLVDWSLYAAPRRNWAVSATATVLHEVLHQIGLGYGLNSETVWLEEGVVQAVTLDLLPGVMRRMRAPYFSSPYAAYSDRVSAVRAASTEATGQAWTSPAARRWRLNLLVTPPDQRTLG